MNDFLTPSIWLSFLSMYFDIITTFLEDVMYLLLSDVKSFVFCIYPYFFFLRKQVQLCRLCALHQWLKTQKSLIHFVLSYSRLNSINIRLLYGSFQSKVFCLVPSNLLKILKTLKIISAQILGIFCIFPKMEIFSSKCATSLINFVRLLAMTSILYS